jgi:hypothetical protein
MSVWQFRLHSQNQVAALVNKPRSPNLCDFFTRDYKLHVLCAGGISLNSLASTITGSALRTTYYIYLIAVAHVSIESVTLTD